MKRVAIAGVVGLGLLAGCSANPRHQAGRQAEDPSWVSGPSRAQARVAPAQPPAQPEGLQTESGTLQGIAAGTFAVAREHAPPLQFRVNGATQVRADGQPTRLDALQQGTPVRVSFQPGQTGLQVAQKIEATARK